MRIVLGRPILEAGGDRVAILPGGQTYRHSGQGQQPQRRHAANKAAAGNHHLLR